MSKLKFLHFGSGASLSKLAEWDNDMDYVSTVMCPVKPGHQRAGQRLPDLSIMLPNNKIEDIVWTWKSECLLTDRALAVFRAGGCTGFEVRPVKARYRRGEEEPPRLWELVVTGLAGMAPPESGIKLIEHCSGCNLSYYSSCTDSSRLIDGSKWDGSDFFTVWPLGKYIFVAERVTRMIREGGLTGVVVKAPGDLEFSGNRTNKISVDLSLYPIPGRDS